MKVHFSTSNVIIKELKTGHTVVYQLKGNVFLTPCFKSLPDLFLFLKDMLF